jgi:release factor glutamine methyltransferase
MTTSMATSIQQGLEQTSERLASISDSAALDAQVLMAHVVEQPRSWILAHPDTPLSPSQASNLEEALIELLEGRPLPYVVGHWEFFGLDLEVTPDVLIPRPETELLVEKALAWLEIRTDARSAIDVGTGTGCIAVSLATRIHGLKLTATDISPRALEVAARNAEKFSVADRIEFICCDLLPPKHPLYDLIVANLPYIPTRTMESLPIYGREPTLALDGGSDGLDLVRRLISLAPGHLNPGGMLLLEIESSQGMAALSLAYDTFSHASIHLHRDLADRDRLIEVQTHAGHDRLP